MSVPKSRDVESLAMSIERIAGDDELISKIVLSYLRELEEHLDRSHAPSDHFYQNILTAHWPYSGKLPTAEEMCLVPKNEVKTPPALKQPEDAGQRYLTVIQKALGKKVKGEELVAFCRFIAKQCELTLHKKSIISKGRLLAWLADHDNVIAPQFTELLDQWISDYFGK